MKDLSTVEALERAIAMLRAIANGRQYGRGEFHGELQRLEEARDRQRRQEQADAAARDAIRRQSETLRALKDKDYGVELGAEATVMPRPA